MISNIDKGRLGENIAEKFLKARAYKILEKNYRTIFGEIDIIAGKKDLTVFVEVKTRISERFGSPFSAITPLKAKHILRSCLYYLKRRGLYEKPCRIDIIGIWLNTEGEMMFLRHIRNAIQTVEPENIPVQDDRF